MSESQGKSDPQNTKEAPSKRDNKNPKARDILSSVLCLWGYLAGITEKNPLLSLVKDALELYRRPHIRVGMVTLLLLLAFSVFTIIFPKSITLIIIALLAIILVIMIIIVYIKYAIKYAFNYIIPIFNFRRLVRILPALINELKGKLPKDIEEDAQKYLQNFPCMERFRGNAAEALSRISQSTFFLMWINLISLSLIPLVILFLIDPILLTLYLLGLKIPLISITSVESVVTKTVVEIASGVLGVALSIIIGLSLFSSQAKFDANTLHFVYDVKFTVVKWFVVAIFLIIISVIIPPIIAIIITVPALIAIIININVYIILVSAIIDYIQLPRNNQGEN
jgi:hypothetical protein